MVNRRRLAPACRAVLALELGEVGAEELAVDGTDRDAALPGPAQEVREALRVGALGVGAAVAPGQPAQELTTVFDIRALAGEREARTFEASLDTASTDSQRPSHVARSYAEAQTNPGISPAPPHLQEPAGPLHLLPLGAALVRPDAELGGSGGGS